MKLQATSLFGHIVAIGLLLFVESTWAMSQHFKQFIHQRSENQKSWQTKWCKSFSLCQRTDFGRSIAMVIGVSDYQYLTPLKYTKNNPEKMKDFLLHEAGFDQVILLTEDNAARETINWFMEKYIPRQFEQEKYSRFVFYFSGRGETRWPNSKKSTGYLRLTLDQKDRWDHSIPMSDVSRWAQQNLNKARHRLFLLDSCFSELSGFEFMDGEAMTLDPFGSAEELINKQAMVMLIAGKSNQPTVPTKDFKSSVFTQALLSGLEGEADKNKDALISSEESFHWVQDAVKNAAESHGHKQIPKIFRFNKEKSTANHGPFLFKNPKRQYQRKTKSSINVYQDPLKDGGLGPKMVVIPAGTMQMGDLAGRGEIMEKPVHKVTIASAFGMSQTEITFTDYERFALATRRGRPLDKGWGRADRPVIYVSWDDAKAYGKWLSDQTGKSYRLPTEAEWEYAARAGSTTLYSWGDVIGKKRANCDGCGSPWDNQKTAPVGQFPANKFGLYDMHGNVWEWVEDCWNASYMHAPIDGSAWKKGNCTLAVLRSGSWYGYPGTQRSAYRFKHNRTVRGSDVGFRLVRD